MTKHVNLTLLCDGIAMVKGVVCIRTLGNNENTLKVDFSVQRNKRIGGTGSHRDDYKTIWDD